MISDILQDALFAAIAAIGFAAISRPPRRAFVYCAVIAAVGHSARMVLMSATGMHIVGASFIASFTIGMLAVFASPMARIPAETCFFPSLLPMIPGIYAYKSFGGLAMCLLHTEEQRFSHYFALFASNGLTCLAVILALVLGATLPVFIFKKVSFQATRKAEKP